MPEHPHHPPDDEAQARAELMRRIEAGSTRYLGDIASVHHPGEDEADDLPWADSASWSPEPLPRPTFTAEELDELFADPDDQIGSVDELGWFGRARHEGRPGGYFLHQTSDGSRDAHEVGTDEEYEQAWERIETHHQDYDAYTRATEAPDPTRSGKQPRIYVASLSDYNAGRLYGAWFNATLDAHDLGAAARFLLSQSSEETAEELAIHDYEDFADYSVGEYDPMEKVSKIAGGIAEHGAAYGAWASYLGGDMDMLDYFEDYYIGTYESTEDYAREHIDQCEINLDGVPEDVRAYLQWDYEGLAREFESTMNFIEGSDGNVYVFNY